LPISLLQGFLAFSCLFGQPSFPGIVRPIEYAPIHLSFEEVVVRAGHEVLMGVDDKMSLIGGAPKGILDQQLKPHLIQLLNITIFYQV
jgi:hypothetical protein